MNRTYAYQCLHTANCRIELELKAHLKLSCTDMADATHGKAIARLEARVSPETKALLQKAADLEGRTLTDFIISSVQAEALRVIQKHQILKLSLEDSEAFVHALLNPPKPNDALRAAAIRYKQVMKD
ncbi:DUF1778 domain-containing protein [Anabaena sp. CCY 9402-a]|uniref:type II toxin-antitoxin system TacA family antitoxin n=1 Tax=Anabaena sp. CCY 9402-a TaxID=3103867 RepID=UPI0039C5CBB1